MGDLRWCHVLLQFLHVKRNALGVLVLSEHLTHGTFVSGPIVQPESRVPVLIL